MPRVRDFKQIAPVDYRTTAAFTQQASNAFNKGLGNVEDLFSDASKRIDAQDAIQTKSNDQTLLSNLQNIKSLGELNQIEQSGAFNVDTLKQKFGNKFTPEALQKGIAETKGKLTKEAVNSSISTFNKALKTPGTDTHAVKRQLIDQLPVEEQLPLLEKLNKYQQAYAQESPKAKATREYNAGIRNLRVQREAEDINTAISQREAKFNQKAKAISPEVAQRFADVSDPKGSINEWFAPKLEAGLGTGSAMRKISDKFQDLTASLQDDRLAAALMVESYQATFGDQKNFIMADLDMKALNKEISRRKDLYIAEQAERTAINEDKLRATQYTRSLQDQAAEIDFNTAIKSGKKGSLQTKRWSPTKAVVPTDKVKEDAKKILNAGKKETPTTDKVEKFIRSTDFFKEPARKKFTEGEDPTTKQQKEIDKAFAYAKDSGISKAEFTKNYMGAKSEGTASDKRTKVANKKSTAKLKAIFKRASDRRKLLGTPIPDFEGTVAQDLIDILTKR